MRLPVSVHIFDIWQTLALSLFVVVLLHIVLKALLNISCELFKKKKTFYNLILYEITLFSLKKMSLEMTIC